MFVYPLIEYIQIISLTHYSTITSSEGLRVA
jgi:hypothetical protein